MKFMIIRHADPNYAIDSLTEAGWKEAKALAAYMEKEYGPLMKEGRIDFYCSPLGRARDTAGETMKALGAKAQIYPWLREFDPRVTDPREGTPRITWDLYPADWAEDDAYYDKDHWWNAPIMATGDNVKPSYDKVVNGIDQILAEHGYVREGKTYRAVRPNHDYVVIFCHMGVGSVIISHLLNCAPAVIWQNTFMAPSSRTLFDTEEREEGLAVFRMKYMGDTSHLALAGLPASESGFYGEVYPEPKRRPDFPK